MTLSTSVMTQAFNNWKLGNDSAKLDIDQTLMQELHRLAYEYMRRENAAHTLQATALVNEAFIRLADVDVNWQDKKHFMSVASKTMRRILVDHAKNKNAIKRKTNKERVTFEEGVVPYYQATEDLIVLDDLLEKLAQFDDRASLMLELSLFGGLTHPEIADVTEYSLATVEREMRVARAWLKSNYNN